MLTKILPIYSAHPYNSNHHKPEPVYIPPPSPPPLQHVYDRCKTKVPVTIAGAKLAVCKMQEPVIPH